MKKSTLARLKRWARIALRLSPAVIAAVPGVPPVLVPVIAQGIVAAEKLKAPGATKKEKVLIAAAAAIDTWNATPSGQAFPKRATLARVSKAIDATVASINAADAAQQ